MTKPRKAPAKSARKAPAKSVRKAPAKSARKAPARKSSPAAPVGAVVAAGAELAPVDATEPEDVAAPITPAPVFPTEADVAAVTAALLDRRPELATGTERALSREVSAALAEHAETIANTNERARARAAADHQSELAALVAPVFPTEQHVAQLATAIPALTDNELDAVLAAGPAAFAASIAAGEPITTTPEADA